MSTWKTSQTEILPRSATRDSFPLLLDYDFEAQLNRSEYVVGVDLDFPAELREMLSAAVVTYSLDNRSIDHVRKTYLKDLRYDEDPGGSSRIDREVRQKTLTYVESVLSAFKDRINANNSDKHAGQFVCFHTIARTGFSVRRAFSEADRGALFECLVIVRMIFEQLCWAAKISNIPAADAVFRTGVTQSIGDANRSIWANSGRFYGWLTKHAHWHQDTHFKTFLVKDETLYHLYGNSSFKAICYASIVTIAEFVGASCKYISDLNVDSDDDEIMATDKYFSAFEIISGIIGKCDKDDDLDALLAMANRQG